MAFVKRVCVVGAGISGLVSIKSCLESDFDVICYEKTDNIGGLWRFRETTLHGVGSVMFSTTAITSKELSAMSDFPPNARFPNYMSHSDILEYLEQYADNFSLRDHIMVSHEVQRVVPNKNYDETGQWNVTVKNNKGKKIINEVFDAVVICTGFFAFPHVPTLPGIDTFQGKVLHSHAYKTYQGLENSRTIVVGIGSSGTNVACELAKVGQYMPVHLSTRTGSWIIPRVADHGKPFDILYARRYLHFLFSRILPVEITNSFFERKLNRQMNHALYRVKPTFHFTAQNATVEDELAIRILTGAVAVRGDILKFTLKGVIFKDNEAKEFPVETVILATGYLLKIPCLGNDIVKLQEDRVDLYNFVFPPLKHNTLAIVGLVQPNGAIIPTAEMQSRWVSKVFNGECQLPNKEEMLRAINNYNKCGHKNPFETDWLAYIDLMAGYIGAKPSYCKMAFTDPQLFFACVFGPSVPYQYRLQGPDSWPKARDAILSVFERVERPLKTRCGYVPTSQHFSLFLVPVCVLVILFLYTLLFFECPEENLSLLS